MAVLAATQNDDPGVSANGCARRLRAAGAANAGCGGRRSHADPSVSQKRIIDSAGSACSGACVSSRNSDTACSSPSSVCSATRAAAR
eukprot:878982-Prymnesium_polylepis.1